MSSKVKDITPPTASNTFVFNEVVTNPADNVTPFLTKVAHSRNMSSIDIKSTPLDVLHKFIKEIREASSDHEIIANKYLALYDKECRFIIKVKDVKKFLPNVNIKTEKKVLELFGVTPTMAMHPKNPKDMLYFFSPHRYILTTMINSVSYASVEDRIEFAFKMYDNDNDGKISKADLKEMFSIYGKENAFRIDNENLEAITNVIFKSMSQGQGDLISLAEFRYFFQSERTKSIKLNVFERRKAKTHFSRIEGPGSSMRESRLRQNGVLMKIQTWFLSVLNLAQKSTVKLIWIFLWGIGMLYFFLSTFLYYLYKIDAASGIAKGSAAVVDYNMAVMILLATKSFTTAIRAIGLAKILPVNINVYLHTRIGYTTLAAAWIHSLTHLIKVLPTIASMDLTSLNSLLVTPVTQNEPYLWWVFQSVPGWTGIVSLVFLTVLVTLAIKQLRTKNFERFWYTHALWFPLILLLSFHGIKAYLAKPQFYYWIGVPALILVMEKLAILMLHFRKQFQLLDLTYLDSEVVELKVSKPRNFKFIPGQYALIKINKLSHLQWHPFSFSSSQDDDYLGFHISPVGDWTGDLKQLALDYKAKTLKKTPSIFIRGPYGAPSQHYTDYKHIMIISSGIGATPFASIMRHINQTVMKDPESNSVTKSVEFYWINKKPSSHIWLTSLFRELQANEAVKGLIKINMFFTNPHEKYDLRSILLWKGLEILYSENIKIKGLEHFDLMRWGRPEWSDIFEEKAAAVGKGKVGVFFCGNSALAKEVHDNCVKKSGDVVFKFCKEIF